jgi:hypothetical protein
MTEINIFTPAYFFQSVPPPQPRIYFDELMLGHMLLTPPHQYTVIREWDRPWPSGTILGRWTLTLLLPQADFPTKCLIPAADLRGATMRWHDWQTNEVKVWALTEETVMWHNKRSLRCGQWPD